MAVATQSHVSEALETLAINTIRTLSIDAVQKANSGHPGLPLGAAAMAYTLWTEFLTHNPNDPSWPDRDRFVLSAGHGSMLLYSLLYLTGYDLSLDDLKNFRQLDSRTPGHPERGWTAGVEVTTGPLGQGFANGVGMAIAEAHLAARFNRPGHAIVDHFTYAIVSDGDLMEGVAMEAAAIAGHLQLGKLVYLYDQNHITLAGSTHLHFTEDIPARFAAVGWHVTSCDGNSPAEIRAAIAEARAVTDKPSIICCRTHIGFGSPKKQDTFGVHGSPLGPEEVAATKANLGWPAKDFFVPEEALELFRSAIREGEAAQESWKAHFFAYSQAHPDLAAEFNRVMDGELPSDWAASLPQLGPDAKAVATRKAGETVLNALATVLPEVIGGSADLNPSTNTIIKNGGDFQPGTEPEGVQGAVGGGWGYAGRNIHWGVREHGMASAVNGMAAHGGVIPYCATFLVFADYCRPALRLAALSHLKSIFVFTHDSIAVGEDGPTHEPVEQVMSLRLIPHLTVIRPADANETASAWKAAIEANGPTALILSRQDLAILDQSGATGTAGQGGYILADADGGNPDVVLVATGSEVELSMMARATLAEHGVRARVVSLPSWELFDAQPEDYRASILGPRSTPRVTVEAGATIGWSRYFGERGAAVGIDTYGASGPGKQVLAHFGFTKENVAATALRLLGNDAAADELEPGGTTAGKPMSGQDGHS